jgi:CubicO group peptidase (beta-lactamase class C family)
MQVTLANWRSSPFNRWAFHHVRELIPSADIASDPRQIRELPVEKRTLDVRVDPDTGEALDLEAFLRETDTDGIAVLHRGKLVFERYANGMTGQTPHILMSVSKSMLGLVCEILAEKGALELDRPVDAIVAEAAATAYRGATIRHLLDMRAGLVWDENYLATSGPIVEYRKATGWNPASEPLSDLHSFYATLRESDRPHGGRFHYTSPNSDLLGWVIERATGARYAELMSELVWKPAGAECSAYITVDRLGAPRCAGGMCATLRDLARVGLWVLEQGRTERFEREGDPEAWAAGDMAPYYPGLPMRYRSKWYVLDADMGEKAKGAKAAPLAFGMGIHGQNLFVDRVNEIVIAKVSSQAMPMDAARIALTMRGISELRKLLA